MITAIVFSEGCKATVLGQVYKARNRVSYHFSGVVASSTRIELLNFLSLIVLSSFYQLRDTIKQCIMICFLPSDMDVPGVQLSTRSSRNIKAHSCSGFRLMY